MTAPLAQPQDPVERLWGPGGFEVAVTADEEMALGDSLLSLPFPCTKPTARRIAKYARGLDHFRTTGGPPDATAVGRTLGLANGAVHDLLNGRRSHWNARTLRRRLVVAYMPRDVKAMVLKLTITESDRNPYAIMTVHAFGAAWRILLAVQRVKLRQRDPARYELEAQTARQLLIDEITQVLTARHLDTVTPVLTGDTMISHNLMKFLVECDQLVFLAEVEKTWSYGGTVGIASLDDPSVPMAAGGTMRELFPPDPERRERRGRSVLHTAFTQMLGPTAIAVGPYGSERFFIGRAHGRPGAELQAEAAHRNALKVAAVFGCHDFSGIADGYGLTTFKCPKDERFQRHCTTLTLRDCFAAKQVTS